MISPADVTSGDIVVVDDHPPGPAYACNGFDAPADAVIALKANVNRAIPLRMELLNGAVPITDSTLVGIEPVVSVSYQSGQEAAVDVTGQLKAVSQSTDGNKFRYDTGTGHETGQWIFNLGTKEFSAAGTYTVTAESGNSDVYILSPTCVTHFVRSN